jgi:hypothetical protein
MSASPAAVPVGLRRRWGESLAGVSLFAEALQVWPDGAAEDRIRRAELALLAGQPRRALDLLEHAGPVVPGSPEHLCGRVLAACARTLAGDLPALSELLADVVRLPPSPALSRLVALSAASSGQIAVAGQAAWRAMRAGCGDHRLLVIAASAAAVEGRHADAVVLAEEAERCRRPAAQDAAETTVNLLRHAGHATAAVALAAVGAQAWPLPAERRAVWRDMADVLRPRRVAPGLPLVRHLVPTWLGRFGRLGGLDAGTAQLVRTYRRQRWRRWLPSPGEAATPLLGLAVALVGHRLALAGPLVADVAALALAVALPVLAVAGVRAYRRRTRARAADRRARQARLDLTCHCEGIVAWLGPEARHYVGHHLVPDPGAQPFTPPARLLRCPATGATFLDLPERPATVSVPTTEEPDAPHAPDDPDW